MGTDGLGKKLVFAGVAIGAILLVLRLVGGREDGDEDAIDRVETGKADDEGGDGEPVDTGLERVDTTDSEPEDDGSEDEVPVEATAGWREDLDLFDMVAILGAAFEAAREEYRNRA